jgi:hypothetical protein
MPARLEIEHHRGSKRLAGKNPMSIRDEPSMNPLPHASLSENGRAKREQENHEK